MDARVGDEVKRKPEPNRCSPQLQARIRAGSAVVLLKGVVVGPQGFEPWTFGLKGRTSPILGIVGRGWQCGHFGTRLT